MSIKVRVTLWYLFILAVALCFLSAVSYLVLSQNINDRIHLPLTPYYTQLKRESPVLAGTASASLDFERLTTYTLSQDGVSRVQSATESIVPLDMLFGAQPLDQKTFITDEVSGAQSVSIYGRLSPTAPDTLEVLVVLQSMTDAGDIMRAFAQVLFFTTPGTLVIAGMLGFILIRRALKPIDAITQAAKGIETQNMQGRIPVNGNDELGRLSAVLNQTFDKVQSSFDREREFTANASHNLKTPLAVMQGEATLALRGGKSREEYEKSLVSISDEITRLSSTIDRLLKLERMDSDLSLLNFKSVDLNAFLADVAEDIGVLCEAKGIKFEFDTSETQKDLWIKGDTAKLRELFYNLADNAIKYTPEGGAVTLALSVQADFAKVSLEDTGAGISAEHLPHIFERFYRVGAPGEELSGAGLGLAICRKIAQLHGGKIEVESNPGSGSKFTLLLPLQP